ncbi:hypothetical protein B0H14DRAFT_2867988 [Mycena olivaceomarginata]|nr:hypothetical protein B0H14DRAFT_2867988 [Mycena olivaceomarginata]
MHRILLVLPLPPPFTLPLALLRNLHLLRSLELPPCLPLLKRSFRDRRRCRDDGGAGGWLARKSCLRGSLGGAVAGETACSLGAGDTSDSTGTGIGTASSLPPPTRAWGSGSWATVYTPPPRPQTTAAGPPRARAPPHPHPQKIRRPHPGVMHP